RAENQGQVGIKGTVVEGGGWRVIGDKESNGGLITMEYTGALSPGNNPSFDITLSTYTDDDNLNIPEGTNMELRGYVSYQNFDGNEGMAWETPGKSDENAIITVVVSNLKWDARLETVFEEGETVDTVPLWDRYQYISYDYIIGNTSNNIESNIDGFTTTFIIDSEGTELNGIIPFDINRFSYIDGKAVPNTDPDLTEGLFVGVPGEGGILIYDITDTDELETPLPYTYSGTGMIEIGRPDLKVGAKEHRQYRIILPLSRQGFPSVPTFFKISTITNISLGGGINWTKTDVNQREIVYPTFEMTMNHTTKEKDVIYGYETYFQITDINNKSNVPIFDPIVKYHQDPDFKVKSVRFTLPKDQKFKDSLHDTFLSYTNDKGEEITHNIPSSYSEDDTSIFFSIDIKDFKSNLVIHLKSEFAKREKTDIDIKIFGEPNRVGELTHTAELVFIEKQASNDEFGENTTYTDVPHYVEIDSTINVIFPEEVKAQLSMGINSSKVQDKNDIYQGTGKYDEAVVLDYYFGTNNEAAESSVFEAVLNNEYAIHNPEITLKKELFDSASDIKLYIIDENDVKKLIIYTYEDEDLTIKINEKVKKVIVETKEFKTDGESHLVSIKGPLNKGLKKTHEISASFSTYQPLPYDKVDTEKVDGLIEIELPNELKPTNQINVKYGSSKSNIVSYESIFDVDFNLNTLGVNSPKASYTIDLLTPSKKGFFEIQNITFDETYVESYIAYDIDGASYENQLPYDKTLVKIEVKLNNFKTSAAVTLVQMQIKAQIDMGSSQDIRAVFKGNQEAPYPDDVTVNATEKVTVFDTKTSVTVKGVNQVNENLGAGNKYSVDIHRYWYYNYANNVNDYTLDQGYKSLGGFTTSMVRPTQKYANNDQTLTLSAQLPNHFDMYYLKIRDDVKDYITTVNIYRTINGKEVLWQSIDGSQWVNNTQEGNFWRINTAHKKNSGEALFSTHQDSKTVDEHPYFKDAWHEDVRPESPVTKVDVILDFNRISNDDAPQLSGETNDVIEYMGRFHTTSKKKEATPILSLDEFGLVATQERGHSHTINSLVGYPYAQTSTGAHDNTTLARKQVLMGTVGEYKASIQNMETHTDPYYRGQGPDIYTPVATEHNEWVHMRNSGFFHDTLIYEFLYPTRVSQDPVYNYQSEYFVIENTPVNKYLDQIIVYGENNSVVTIDKIDFEGAVKVNYVDGLTPGYEIVDGEINLTLGKDISPLKFEAYFKQIQGFGEKTAEIDGNVQDTLGAVALVDIRVGGVVNGDKDLTGTTNLYRLPDDSKAKTRVHTSSAVLSGITPKLNGQISMKFDEVKVYDYGKDGVTPNKTTIEYDLVNRGEADITDIVMTLTPDQNFRTQEIKVPKEIFDGDYSVDTVRIEGKDVASHFVLKGDYYILDLLDLFDKGILKQSSYKRGTITYNKLDTRKIEVSFISKTDAARLYGQFTKNETNDQTLSSRMIEGSYVFVSGVWADQSTSGLWDWDSTPTYVTEGTKARSEVITSYSSFDITAEVTSKQSIYVSSGTGNQGQKPRLVHKSSSNNSTAPRLYNRGAKLTLYATHLDNDMSTSDNNNLFFDKDTDKQVSYTNLTVGDTNYILYRIHNNGKLAADDISAGDIPVFNPYFELQVPLGLKISSTEVLTDKPTYINDDNFISGKIDEETISDKKYELTLDNTLEYGESVYVLVKLETINDFGSELFASQNKTMRWQAYARPYKMHAFNSFDGYGSNGYRVTGRNNELMASNYYANTYNSDYRFSNPNKLRIVSIFDVENVSGQDMTLTISNIENETLHSNTQLELFLTLDKNKNQIVSVQGNTHGGFELTEFPTPESMPGYAKPEIYFLHEKTWIKASDFDKNIHDMKAINELKIDYGIVDDNFVAPSFTVSGIGHWKTLGSLSTKNYNIYSTVELVLTHDSNSSYKYITENHKTAHKAIAQTEFNLQAFETLDEANTPYNGALVGKHSYKPGDVFYNKITLKNINNFQGINTNTPYGKADLLNPVIYDKIPEYISIDDVEIRILDSEGNVRTHIAPVIKESTIEGLDVGGMQTFANDRHNDSFGLLSSAEPADTHKNEAEKITYKLIEYHFEEEDLKRGEVLEIVYKTTVRKEGLPYAMYPDGRPVYAPLLGWYTNNTPNASLNQNYTMDMASLLHDVGLSGNKGHELTENEFLSNSSSWTHGSLRKRRLPSNTSLTQDTYYDESANKQVTHQTWLKEEKDNTLYVSFTGAKDEVFDYLTK
ncbi:MAG: hypothetical protein GX038_07080, partial [Erysipelothrix sp.]|nr:hypothetical protein [Erysipelothrix sp.]